MYFCSKPEEKAGILEFSVEQNFKNVSVQAIWLFHSVILKQCVHVYACMHVQTRHTHAPTLLLKLKGVSLGSSVILHEAKL